MTTHEKTIYTIGHSTHKIENFISFLNRKEIDVVVDVRSLPYSKFSSQFNKECLRDHLKKEGIGYIFMGDMLGARWDNSDLLFGDGKVNFEFVSETILFQKGIIRLDDGIARQYRISLMCSEKEPFDCHRFALVARFLSENGINVKHIYPNGNELIEFSQIDLENRMIEKYKKEIPEKNLFCEVTHKERLKEAYRLRNIDIAYNVFTKEGDDE